MCAIKINAYCFCFHFPLGSVLIAVNWYRGEIGFFDFYIVPLAKKLKECGVFGVSSGE